MAFVDTSDDLAVRELITAAAYLFAGLSLALGARSLGTFFRRMWWGGRGVTRVRRVDLVDVGDVVRARLAIERTAEGREDIALTLFDEDERARMRLGTQGGYAADLQVSDESGRVVSRFPAERA